MKAGPADNLSRQLFVRFEGRNGTLRAKGSELERDRVQIGAVSPLLSNINLQVSAAQTFGSKCSVTRLLSNMRVQGVWSKSELQFPVTRFHFRKRLEGRARTKELQRWYASS